MNDKDKTKEELIIELKELHQELNSLKEVYKKEITECRQTEIVLRHNEVKWHSLLQTFPGFIAMHDRDGKYIFLNRYADGYSEKNVIGKSLYEFISDESKATYREAFNNAYNTGKVQYVEFSGLGENGSLRFYFCHIVPVYENNEFAYFLALANDITERKQTEEALRESQTLLKTVLNNAPITIFATDDQGLFTLSEGKGLENVGLKPGENIGVSAFDLYGSSPFVTESGNVISGLNLIKRILAGESWNVFSELGKVYFDNRMGPLRNASGEIIGIVGVATDITERKQVEDELKLKNEELRRINAEKDKFFSIISHDLRSPFNSFLGLTRLMAEELPSLKPAEIQKYVLAMKKSAEKLYNLLENLLEWSLMQRGLRSFNPKSFILLNGIAEIIELVRNTAEIKKIRISYDVPEDFRVMADEQMFGSVMRNLIFNAIKFTPKDGRITITAKPLSGNFAEISIEDTGIGMSKDLIDNLFRLDLNTSRTGTEGEPSTGLGLIISRDFVERQGGKLWVESEEGKGLIFYFTLPSNT